ncbi:DUF4880 domain-containing protein [Pseudomonas putida]|uniref:DUF4880 domain-containing protein n=1 Tax=Pseudomonas putida TaxID=303 RepID=A0A1Q9R0G3_PSEPU|nr:DUF4880 domain-containing protein [Pseudomonas putida]OLS60878.1 hypothetical protein PSEMO_42810 [Pseudomonas putida]
MKAFQPLDRQAIDEQVLEQALQWMVLLQSGVSSDDERLACDAWRAQSAAHELAWQRLAGLNQDLRQNTRNLAPASARSLLRARSGSSRRTLLKGIAGLALLTAAGAGVRERSLLPELFSDYRTGTGQRQRLQLAGGTTLQLDTRTALDQEAGDLSLNLGRVLISTGPQAALRIRTQGGWVMPGASSQLVIGRDLPGVHGTQLQVFSGSATLQLAQGDRLMLGAGQQLRFSNAQASPQAPVSSTDLAWSNGLLVVERMPLGLLLAHLDRYRHGVLRCAPEVAGLAVSGSYSLEHPEASLELLTRLLPIRVERVLGLWTTVLPA